MQLAPTYRSWLNLIERWARNSPGCSCSVARITPTDGLEAAVNAWIDGWDADPRPFIWHQRVDEIT
jgi:hypothetical protein